MIFTILNSSAQVIGGQVTDTSFSMAFADRVASKTGAAATFNFKTSAGGVIAAGGTITLTYPLGFFSHTPTPGASISGGASGSC